jgi:multidrug efflux system membrane fusion protein
MNPKKIAIALAAVLVVAALIAGHRQMNREQAADAEADQPIAAAARVQRDADGTTVITLAVAAQQLAGLQTETLVAATLPPEVSALGRVLDSATLVTLENEAVAARATLQVAQREYARLKNLSAQDNASVRALETADAEMKRDQSALATAEAQLMAASAKAVPAEPAEFFRSLARQESVLVRLDLPAGDWPAKTPRAAQLTLPGAGPPVIAGFLDRAATTDPQTQGAGFLFLVTNAPPALTPGLVVTGRLQLPGEPLRGVIVPDAAVIRSDARAWIYVQTGGTGFARREIKPDFPAPGGWFLTNGVAPGDKVVVTGAQTLLSEERKSRIKLED